VARPSWRRLSSVGGEREGRKEWQSLSKCKISVKFRSLLRRSKKRRLCGTAAAVECARHHSISSPLAFIRDSLSYLPLDFRERARTKIDRPEPCLRQPNEETTAQVRHLFLFFSTNFLTLRKPLPPRPLSQPTSSQQQRLLLSQPAPFFLFRCLLHGHDGTANVPNHHRQRWR
jgi:hypothetical protein